MALNITPRSYQVDPTGRAYAPDNSALLASLGAMTSAALETARAADETAQRGAKQIETFAARRQLASAKSVLSRLDPSDPSYGQQLGLLAMDHPLAFTNPATATAASSALKLASQDYARRQELQDRMALAQSNYDYNVRLANLRQNNAMEQLRFRADNPTTRATSTPRPSFLESIMLPQQQGAPAASPPAVEPVGPPNPMDPQAPPFTPEDLPTDTGSEIDPSLLMQMEGDPGLVEGQGDGPGRPANMVDTRLGPAVITGFSSAGPTGRFVQPAAPLPPRQGYDVIPTEVAPDGTVTKYEYLAQKDAPNPSGLTAPEIRARATEVAQSLTAPLLAQEKQLYAEAEQARKAKDEFGNPVGNASELEYRAAVVAAQRRFQEAQLTDYWSGRYRQDPEALQTTMREAAVAQSLQPGGENFVGPMPGERAAQPAAAPTAPSPVSRGSIADQLSASDPARQAENTARNEGWTSAKSEALGELKRVSQALGVAPDDVLKAVVDQDPRGVQTFMTAAANRNIQTPLFQPNPSLAGFEWGTTEIPGDPRWQKNMFSPGITFEQVLKEAAKDPDALASAGLSTGLPQPKSKDEFDALPSGARFVDPSGNIRRKP